MSQAKKDRVSHLSETQKTEAALIKGVVLHLRKIGGASTSAVKRIARETGTNPRTVKAWYEGRNIPNLCGFIHLARCYPGLIDLFLGQCQRKPERLRQSRQKTVGTPLPSAQTIIRRGQNLAENVPNDVPSQIDSSSCNIRQLWFINTLLEGEKVFATDIAAHWRVTVKTAKRDITGLKSAGLIVYRGARRSGFYEIAHQPMKSH